LQSKSTKFAELQRYDKPIALLEDHVLSATPSLFPPLSSIAPSSQATTLGKKVCGH
jgi:hypothetical protein